MKYIDAEKLIKSVNNYREGAKAALNPIDGDADYYKGKIDACENIQELITYLQQEQPEVDFDSALTGFMGRYAYENSGEYPSAIDIAHHFYELGQFNARKEE